jgi:hypothetical protein
MRQIRQLRKRHLANQIRKRSRPVLFRLHLRHLANQLRNLLQHKVMQILLQLRHL